nr:MAG TPA: hypothetical protein [Caudoviricetes sp.]
MVLAIKNSVFLSVSVRLLRVLEAVCLGHATVRQTEKSPS